MFEERVSRDSQTRSTVMNNLRAILCFVPVAVIIVNIYLVTQYRLFSVIPYPRLPLDIAKRNALTRDALPINKAYNVTSLTAEYLRNVTISSRFLSPDLTKVTVVPHPDVIRVGDSFQVNIQLFCTDGKPVNMGGDYLKMWLKEPDLQANVNGHVKDHGNGTYTGVVLLPWKGHPEVTVSIANTRHHISLIMRYLEEHGTLNTMASKFIDASGKYMEDLVCSPKPDVDLEGCGFRDRCNSTNYNYGLPWFCCKPKSKFLTCDDIKTQESRDHTSLSKIAVDVSKNHKHIKVMSVKTKVLEGVKGNGHLMSPPLPCRNHPPGATWQEQTPSGYYYKKSWVNLKCKSEVIDYKSCLKNRNVVVLGDSNSRGVYDIIKERTSAIEQTSHYTKGKPWHKLLRALNTESNIDLMWAPHNPPFYVGPHQSLDTMRSVGNWLDRVSHDKPNVVIIHLFYHLTRTTLSVFRAFVKDARAGVDRLLARDPGSTVIIQGPHSITFKKVLEPIDYLRRCQEDIWYQEFLGSHEKVYYVRNWDRTSGMENVNMHPQGQAMLDLSNEMLSYFC
ncbi:NXPE family member 3-like isoform X2 [Argopecten irradians]|uniref:NXPE family member 3-like isoform X2 n=1 Tax=Argopecten irradians TaxID=31199 RepID=UPI003718CC72